MPTPIDHLFAMLAQLTPSQLAALPPARLKQLSDALYAGHVLAEMAAAGDPFPTVRRAVVPTVAPAPEVERTIEAAKEACEPAGVLARLAKGHRSE